jgi:hypothetical protein
MFYYTSTAAIRKLLEVLVQIERDRKETGEKGREDIIARKFCRK